MGLFVYALVLILTSSATAFLKLTNVQCIELNKSWIVMNECRLRAIKRNTVALYINATILKPASKVHINIAVVKKANGYKPFFSSVSFDACYYNSRRNHPFVNILAGLIKDYSNWLHKCPYFGNEYISGLIPKEELFKGLPIPDGEYGLLVTYIFHGYNVLKENFYAEIRKMDM